MKILHTADIHAREKDIEEITECLGFMLDNAVDEEVDLAIIAGDCFDSRDIKLDSQSAKLIIKTISELADQCPVMVVLGTPSHDGTAPEILNYAQGVHKIVVASKPEQINIRNEVVLSLIPTPTKQFFQTESGIAEANVEIAQAMNGLFAGMGAKAAEFDCPHILVGHWQVAGSVVSTGQVLTGHDIDIPFDSMMLANPDLICLGHIHKAQQIGDRAFYPGSLYPLTWGELEAKGFYIHTLDGRKLVESRFIETPCRKLVRMQADMTKGDDAFDKIPGEKFDGAFVRMDITCWQDEVSKINKEEATALFKGLGALDVDIRIIRIPRETVRSEAVLKVDSLRDKIKAMAELRGETVTEDILKKADSLEVAP
jgi:exonuclease SbcC